jgi:predicted CXXCH cytochrome family protein
MKKWLFFVLAVVMATGGSTIALAGVEGTHHDMGTYMGAGKDACYSCHGFKETSAANPNLGPVGSMCYNRCHLGGGGISGSIPLADLYPEIGTWDNTANLLRIAGPYGGSTLTKYTEGHKLVITSIPSPDTAAMVRANTTWPYTGAAFTSMECTSCHDVHSNTNAPFLRLPLSDNGTRANAFCHKCHGAVADGAARYVDEYNAAPNGSHPSEVGYGMAVTTLFSSGAGRLGRTIVFKDRNNLGAVPAALGDNGVFRNWSPSGTALNSSSTHYNPGGKLGDFQGAGNVGCYTCHATHLPAASGMQQLTVANSRAAGATMASTSAMCVGCHGAGSGINPGTTSYYHPVDMEVRPVNVTNLDNAVYQVTVGGFNIAVNMNGVFDNAVGVRLSCLSCHGGADAVVANAKRGVHASTVASRSIISPLRPTCASCHAPAGGDAGTSPNSHHVVGGGATAVARYATNGYPNTVTFSAGVTADLTQALDCSSCHKFPNNGTAHNWN